MEKLKPKHFTYIKILKKTDKELLEISKKNLLSLNIHEMKAIQSYYKKIKRNPSDVELETIAQTWSEHCKHKTLTGIIKYTYKDEKTGKIKTEIIDNLLKSTIMKATKELNKDWCLSVFQDNAGVIEFDEYDAIAFKVETHNHPSALEPYGGAGTGIGGVIRDILGVGLGAKPIFNTDVFCFGMLNTAWVSLEQGVLHPKQIMKGVVEGVRDYGNRMGIPTINGAVLFDKGFTYNPLVFCGTAGIMPKNAIDKKVKINDYIVAIGGKTGRDGIHGATFSSIALDANTESSAVQIGNPIIEKKILDTLLIARDKKLYNSLTDCGAGGFSSAIGELGEKTGAEVHLDKVSLKYDGLKPWEIWVSEAQERMVLAVPENNLDEIIKIFESEDVEVSILGRFTDSKKLKLFYKNEKICELDMDFLHNGIPRYEKEAESNNLVFNLHSNNTFSIASKSKNFYFHKDIDFTKTLKKMLSHPNVCSKEWIIRQYDYEVQGGTIIKPLQGKNYGPGDSAVVKPKIDTDKGVAIGCGINFEYGKFDPYKMTLALIDEALRNIVCCGGVFERIAFLDNFCWGDPNDKQQLGGIVRACKACYDASIAFGIPFISGKDSLNNTYLDKNGKKISIPPTLLISAIAVLKDIKKCITMNFKKTNNVIYIIGNTNNEMLGSIYSLVNELNFDTNLINVDMKLAKRIFEVVNKIVDKKLIESMHDCSDGGLGVAIAEMAIAGDKGVDIDISNIVGKNENGSSIIKLFSESASRFIIEVNPENTKDFEKILFF
ncbi:MAG: phosphoribosylformylglycinamidine synthase subunit PurL, partial [Elusimicrobiota bacterium]|nr:phosphoribosylformylglycinamidine synthase subunit PurL [Elusimicrobiota bacterium]